MRIHHETITVGPESIDVQGHVNNREYLRWMEHAATRHAETLGWGLADLRATARAWVAREHWIEYLHPVFEGETIEIRTWVQSLRGAASLRRYAITRGEELVCVGATEWVYVDAERGRPALFDDETVARVAPLLVAEGDEELKRLGVARPVRFSPGPNLLGRAPAASVAPAPEGAR